MHIENKKQNKTGTTFLILPRNLNLFVHAYSIKAYYIILKFLFKFPNTENLKFYRTTLKKAWFKPENTSRCFTVNPVTISISFLRNVPAGNTNRAVWCHKIFCTLGSVNVNKWLTL